MTLRRGETLLLTIGIPVLLLVFFSWPHVVTTPTTQPRRLRRPGHPGAVRALHVAGGALDRHGLRAVLRRAAPPARDPARTAPPHRRQGRRRRRHRGPPGRGPDRRRARRSAGIPTAARRAGSRSPRCLLLGSAGCAGIGLALAGRLRAEVNLAASNGLYLVLLLVSGIVVPVTRPCRRSCAGWSSHCPRAPWPRGCTGCSARASRPRARTGLSWALWAVLAPLVAARTFRFD